MRPLTEEETRTLFEKLAKYIGKNIVHLLNAPTTASSAEESATGEQTRFCFRLHRDRVYYVSEEVMRKATNISRDLLSSLGICLGKFTSKTRQFRLQITALPILAPHAQYKVWLKAAGEMPFLYGNHVIKGHIGRMTEDTPEHVGVVIFNSHDIPLGFGVTARAAIEQRRLEPTTISVFHQADCGEYLRHEDTLF